MSSSLPVQEGIQLGRQASLTRDERHVPTIVQRKTYSPGFDALIANNDALTFLSDVPNETFQLVVTSPPYNLGKSYERRGNFQEYLAWNTKIFEQCTRTLKTGGSLCWEIGNYIEKGEVFPLDAYFYSIIKQNPAMILRNRIIWFFEHGLHATQRLSGRYETILWFTKGEDYVFNLDQIRVKQKYPGKRYYKGPKRGSPSANQNGKNPGDVWKVLKEDWDASVWDIPNVKANHPEKTIHPAQFPIELVERLVIALTNERDIVFDPFMGVGSTIAAALLHDRAAVGVEKEATYVKIALERAQKAGAGTLRHRVIGTEKHVPSTRDKVAQVPPEWSVEGSGNS